MSLYLAVSIRRFRIPSQPKPRGQIINDEQAPLIGSPAPPPWASNYLVWIKPASVSLAKSQHVWCCLFFLKVRRINVENKQKRSSGSLRNLDKHKVDQSSGFPSVLAHLIIQPGKRTAARLYSVAFFPAKFLKRSNYRLEQCWRKEPSPPRRPLQLSPNNGGEIIPSKASRANACEAEASAWQQAEGLFAARSPDGNKIRPSEYRPLRYLQTERRGWRREFWSAACTRASLFGPTNYQPGISRA